MSKRVREEETSPGSSSGSGDSSTTEDSEDDGSSSSYSSSSSSSELELAMDERGRVACDANPKLRYEATTRERFVKVGKEETRRGILRDCEAAHTAKTTKKKKNSAYSSGSTFWVGAEEKPRCALEALALETFRLATEEAFAATRGEGDGAEGGAGYDPTRSGAEWWTQVIDDRDEIGWHWDKDYALEQSGVNVHPQLGTVTYFCDRGAPTVIVDRPTDVQYDEESGDVGSLGTVSECAVSWPRWGKQITFDGKFLHGAPLAFAARERESGKRVTFLVNIWLNHKPVTAEPLTEDELESMTLRDVTEAASWVDADCARQPFEERPVRAPVEFKFDFTYSERPRTILLNLDSSIKDCRLVNDGGHGASTALFTACCLGELT